MSTGIREPFFSHGYAEIENISEKISNNMETLNDLIRELESYVYPIFYSSFFKYFCRKKNLVPRVIQDN